MTSPGGGTVVAGDWRKTPRWRSILPALAMTLAVAAVYLPPPVFTDSTLIGIDYWQLHHLRIDYARDNLAEGRLPHWHTRELLGGPFLANLQAFPWIPTRLAVLALPPERAHAAGVATAAVLAALFTYLLARRLGQARTGAALAGFTFACAGYFASRVLAGHLPLLEAYPAAPMLLWAVERVASARGEGRSRAAALGLLAGATGATALAGHPQLPFFAIGSAALYAIVCGREARPALIALALGGGLALFAWVPMLHVLGESTRLVSLPFPESLKTNVALPWHRLAAFFRPWADGAPAVVGGAHPEYAGPIYVFWDTVIYLGWAPWLALAWLGATALRGRQLPDTRALFFAVLGLGALALALPWSGPDRAEALLLRSPARLLYLTTLGLALGLGGAASRLARRPGGSAAALLVLIASVHVADLAIHARAFVRTRQNQDTSSDPVSRVLAAELGSARIAVGPEVDVRRFSAIDRLGFFDSLILRRPYLTVLGAAGLPPIRMQRLTAAELDTGALRRLGVRFVASKGRRGELAERARAPGVYLHEISDPEPRARFFPLASVRFQVPTAIARERRAGLVPGEKLLLPLRARGPVPTAAPPEGAGRAPPEVRYARPEPDRIELHVRSDLPGFVRVLESWSAGWSARVDGASVPLFAGDGFALAVAVPAGSHRVELTYRAPGRQTGLLASAGFALGLAGFLAWQSTRDRKCR